MNGQEGGEGLRIAQDPRLNRPFGNTKAHLRSDCRQQLPNQLGSTRCPIKIDENDPRRVVRGSVEPTYAPGEVRLPPRVVNLLDVSTRSRDHGSQYGLVDRSLSRARVRNRYRQLFAKEGELLSVLRFRSREDGFSHRVSGLEKKFNLLDLGG